MSDRELDDLLRFDPLATAERVTGESYRDDPASTLLGLSLFSAHVDAKDAALTARGDTRSSMPFGEHLAVFASLGFAIVLDEPFEAGDGTPERFVVLWHPEGVLGSCESYGRLGSTNKSNMAYAWRPGDLDGDWWGRLTSSGGIHHGVWYGDHDTREGLRHKFNALRAEGSFLSDWSGRRRWPRPWEHLGTYAEWDGGNGRDRWNEVRQARFLRLPAVVREAIGDVDA